MGGRGVDPSLSVLLCGHPKKFLSIDHTYLYNQVLGWGVISVLTILGTIAAGGWDQSSGNYMKHASWFCQKKIYILPSGIFGRDNMHQIITGIRSGKEDLGEIPFLSHPHSVVMVPSAAVVL